MTKIASNLELMRNEWYNAFSNLDIEMLDYLEADWFFSTNGQTLIYKKHQLRKLSILKSDNTGVFNNIKRHESNVHITTFNSLAAVTGTAEIIGRNGGIKNINFIESWIKIRDCWKLQFQSFENSS